jgi:hypothetical protein
MESLFSKQLEEGEIMCYMELWDNIKQVTTRMSWGGGGGHEEGVDI